MVKSECFWGVVIVAVACACVVLLLARRRRTFPPGDEADGSVCPEVLARHMDWLVTFRTQVDSLVWARFQYFLAIEALLFGVLVSKWGDLPAPGVWRLLPGVPAFVLSLAWAEFSDRGGRSLRYWITQIELHHDAYLKAHGLPNEATRRWLPWADLESRLHDRHPRESEGTAVHPRLAAWAYRYPQMHLTDWAWWLALLCALGWALWMAAGVAGIL